MEISTAVAERPIGELFDPVNNREGLADLLQRARSEEPVFFAPQFDSWVATSYKDVKYIMDHAREFSSVGTLGAATNLSPEAVEILERGVEYPTPPVLANSDAPIHGRLRGAVNRELSPRRFADMEPLLHDIASNSIARFESKGEVEFVRAFAFDFPLTVIMGVLGLPLEDMPQIKRWGAAWVQLLFDINASTELQVERARDVVEYQDYLTDYIAAVRAAPRDDFVSGMVAAVDEGKMTHSELVHLIGLNVIPGAHESTSSLLTSCIYNFLSDRSRWEALCADPSLIPNAIEEVLRLDGPGVGFYRRAARDIQLGDKQIATGDCVFYCHFSANQDELVFENSRELDIHRDNARMNIGFGHGNHFCLGAPLARREARVAMELLTRHLPSLRLVPGQTIEYVQNFVLRSITELRLEWTAGESRH